VSATTQPSAPDPPPTDDPADAQIEAAEQEALELHLASLRESLPDYLDLDDEGNVVPAEGFQICPACRGTTVIPEAAPLSPLYAPCPHCQGWGRVSTGSRLSETANITCDSCQGNGFVKKQDWIVAHPGEPSPWENENAE